MGVLLVVIHPLVELVVRTSVHPIHAVHVVVSAHVPVVEVGVAVVVIVVATVHWVLEQVAGVVSLALVVEALVAIH